MRAFGFLHRLFILGTVTALVGGVIGVAVAAQPIRVNSLADFRSLQQTIMQLKQDAEKAECGGWTEDFEQSVLPMPQPGAPADTMLKIAQVIGLPGHNNGFFADEETLKSGLARRAGQFTFPDSAQGLSTACAVAQESEDHCGNKFPYKHDPYVDLETSCVMPPELDPPPPNGSFEGRCEKLKTELNKWVRGVIVFDDSGLVVPETEAEHCRNGQACAPNELDYRPFPVICYDPDGNLICHHDDVYCCTNSFVEENAIPCNGANCRKGGFAENGNQYVSYYRKYTAGYFRGKVKEVRQDVAAVGGLIVRCYSRYVEFDPKAKYTGSADQHCVIDFMENMGALKIFQNMKETQLGKGKYEQSSSSSDPTYPPRKRENMAELWVNDYSGAFSMLNGEKVGNEDEDLISLAPQSLLVLDTALLVPTAQVSKDQIFSSGSLIRAFDDTVSLEEPDIGSEVWGTTYRRPGRRTVTEWWQEQETQMHKMLTPPILRLLLPSPVADGIQPDTPLLNPRVIYSTQSSSADGLPPHTKAIDIQIHADTPDLLDEVSQELADALLLRVTEAPMPVVVPLASPAELRAMAQGWLSWGKARGESDDAEAIAEKLQTYAKQIEDVRTMRAELSQYAGKLLTFQNEMSKSIAEWIKANADGYSRYNSEWQTRVSTYQSRWQQIQLLMRKFHDKSNFPWCRNDRFTTPIYSLLDPWIPAWNPGAQRDLAMDIDRSPSQGQSPSDLPRMNVEPMPDLVFDFSALRIGSGVLLPVLKPIQLRIDLTLFRVPSSATAADDDVLSKRIAKIKDLPDDLPPVPSIFKEVKEGMIPSDVIKVKPPSPLSERLPQEPSNASGVLDRMQTMLQGMNTAYETFWKSLMEDRSQDTDKWNCVHLATLPCVHVEMDLLERFTRIGARPAVLLKEDLQSLGYLRTASSSSTASLPFSAPDSIKVSPQCPRTDWACQVMNVESMKPKDGWRTEGMQPKPAGEAIDRLRNTLREDTIPEDKDGEFRYAVPPNDILPSFNIPLPVDIIPSAGASSSSSRR